MDRWLVDPRGVRFAFDSGCTSMDFSYTGGDGPYAVFEVLHRPGDLSGWLTRSDLHLPMLTVDDELLGGAKTLRSAIWAVYTATATGTVADPAAVSELNAWARQQPLVPQLGGDDLSFMEPTVTQALSSLARETVELVTSHPARIRQCAAADCPLMFYDTSRSGARRWCSMQRCGNRSKVRSHRERIG